MSALINASDSASRAKLGPVGSGGAEPSTERARPGLRARRQMLTTLILGLAGIGIVMLAWNGLRMAGVFPASYVPSVQSIIVTIVSGFRTGQLSGALGHTAAAAGIGLAIATVLAVPLGVMAGTHSRWARATGLLTSLLRPLPPPALLPAAILFAGLSLHMEVLLVAFASVWPLYYNTVYGSRSVDTMLVDAGRSLHYGGFEQLSRVTIPAALPSISTGLRLSTMTALIVSVSVELVAGNGGMGTVVELTRSGTDITMSYAAVVVVGIVGYCINTGLLHATRKMYPWLR